VISFGTVNNVLWNPRAMQNPGWETPALRVLQCLWGLERHFHILRSVSVDRDCLSSSLVWNM